MYCCITIRLAVDVTAADTLLDLGPMLLTVSSDLQVRGVLIRDSLVQNGIVSEYKYHRPKLITAAFEYPGASLPLLAFQQFRKNSRSCCYEFIICNLVTKFTKYSYTIHIGRQSPTLLEKCRILFGIPFHTKKRQTLSQNLWNRICLFYCLLGARSHSHGNAPLRVSRLHEGRYTPKHQRACLCPSLPHL